MSSTFPDNQFILTETLHFQKDKLVTDFSKNQITIFGMTESEQHDSSWVRLMSREERVWLTGQPVFMSGRMIIHFALSEFSIYFNHLHLSVAIWKDMLLTKPEPSENELYNYINNHDNQLIDRQPVDLSCTDFSHVTIPFNRVRVGRYDALIYTLTWYWSGPPPEFDEQTGVQKTPSYYNLTPFLNLTLKYELN